MANYEEPANSKELELESELKKKYGKIYKVSVDNEGKPCTGYFKDIDFKTASAVARLVNSDPLGSQKVLVQNTIIKEHSDNEILNNWRLTVGVGQELQKLIDFPNASVVIL